MANTSQGQVKIFNTALTADDATAQEQLGALRTEQTESNGENVYMYVLAGGAIADGNILSYANAAGTSVAVNTTNAEGAMGAVAIGIGTITSGQYGWVLVRGYHSAIASGSEANTAYENQITLCGKAYDVTDSACTLQHSTGIVALCTKASACTTFPGKVSLL